MRVQGRENSAQDVQLCFESVLSCIHSPSLSTLSDSSLNHEQLLSWPPFLLAALQVGPWLVLVDSAKVRGEGSNRVVLGCAA